MFAVCLMLTTFRNDLEFFFSPTQMTITFKRVCKRVGIVDFRFHDLRHTAASWAQNERR